MVEAKDILGMVQPRFSMSQITDVMGRALADMRKAGELTVEHDRVMHLYCDKVIAGLKLAAETDKLTTDGFAAPND